MEQMCGRAFSGLVWWLFLFSGCACLNTFCSEDVLLRAELGRAKTISFFNDKGNLTEAECGWRVETSQADEVVQLRMLVVDISGGVRCASDSLAIFDSSGPYPGRRLALLCGDDREFRQYRSSGRSVFVQFKALHLDLLKGFSLHYRAAKRWGDDGASSTAGTTLQYDMHTATTLNASQGDFQYVSSPGYPSPYHSQESLVWVIRSGPGEVVHLHVEDMDLQTLADCGPNTVTVFDSDSVQGRQLAVMCNVKYRGADLHSTGQAMTIAFTSARADYGRGFDLGYKAAPSSHVKKGNVWTSGTDDDDDGGHTMVSHDVVMIVLVSGSLLFTGGLITALGVFVRHRWIIRPRSAGRVISVPGSDAESSRALLDLESPESSDSESGEPGHPPPPPHPHPHHPEDSQNHLDVPTLNLWMSTHLPEMAANQLNNMEDSHHHHHHNKAARQPNEAAIQPTVGACQPQYGSPSSPRYGNPSSAQYGSPSSARYGNPSSARYGNPPAQYGSPSVMCLSAHP